MKIEINKKERTFDAASMTLAGVMAACGMPEKGIAVAVNNRVVRRGDWNNTYVADGDCLTVIQAVCGG